MSKIKRARIVLEVDEKPKKELRHGASTSADSNIKSNRVTAKVALDSTNKDIDVSVSSGSSMGIEIKSDTIKANALDGPDTSAVGQGGKATKSKEKRTADLVVHHKFK